MAQAQVRQFPGYGVVYPDGVSGIKVIHTYTQAPSKIINPDGSISYTTPPPTIHELFGGGFAYADGSPVNKREHLEELPQNMRERALKWFDEGRTLSEVATKDVPPLVNPEDRERPEPVYVVSSDVTNLDESEGKVIEQPSSVFKPEDILASISKSISSIAETVKEQGKQIAALKKRPPAPRRMARSEAKHGKQSETMKARWADPEYKAKMLKANPALRKANVPDTGE